MSGENWHVLYGGEPQEVGGPEGHVATVHTPPREDGMPNAEARLIAAAPDLLGCCEEVYEWLLDPREIQRRLWLVNRLQSAIRKGTL